LDLILLDRKSSAARLALRIDISRRSPSDLESKDRTRLLEAARLPHTQPALVFIGLDDRPTASEDSVPAAVDPQNPKGVPYFALDVGQSELDVAGFGGEWGDARNSASAMSGWEAGVFAQGRALIDWNVRNKVG
jgi:NAD+ diphosphatase